MLLDLCTPLPKNAFPFTKNGVRGEGSPTGYEKKKKNLWEVISRTGRVRAPSKLRSETVWARLRFAPGRDVKTYGPGVRGARVTVTLRGRQLIHFSYLFMSVVFFGRAILNIRGRRTVRSTAGRVDGAAVPRGH